MIAGQAVEMTAPTGTTIMFSSIHPNEKVPEIWSYPFLSKTITGAVSPTVLSFHEAVQMIGKGLLDPTVLTEKIYDYQEFDEAIKTASRPDTYKVILKFGE